MTSPKNKEPLFLELNPDDFENGIVEIESLCTYCHQNGMTRMILTKIPHFREVIISSFSCEKCGYEDRSMQSGDRIQEKGIRYEVTIKNPKDLDRQVVKSEVATISIPELEFEQPPARKGEVTTIEGLIDGVKADLEIGQEVRRITDPDIAEKLDAFIEKLVKLKNVESPFEIIIDDPSGNSFIENLMAPLKDESMKISHYRRTPEHNELLGITVEEQVDDEKSSAQESGETVDHFEKALNDEVLTFTSNCPNCNAPCETNMKMVDIPFFKQTVIMATFCEACGHRDNEVKSGTGIADRGTKHTLRLTNSVDLTRDLLKSETCGLKIPEIELEMVEGTLGGKFTTIEGLLTDIRDQLLKNPFLTGDSADSLSQTKMQSFCEKLEKIISGKLLNVHIILDDPAGNSYLQNLFAPDNDPELEVTHYTRTHEQNDLLGLNDMKTENYNEES